MAEADNKTLCFSCNKEKITYSCRGCDKEFCFAHLQEHRQVLNGQLDEIINDHDQFKQTINEYGQNATTSSLIKQIDQWEQTSIEKIRTTAQQCRETVFNETRSVVDQIQMKLGEFTGRLKHVQKENEFNEVDLRRLNKKLTEMKEELTKPSTISIEEGSQTLINNIHVSLLTSQQKRLECKSLTWKQHANTVAGGNGQGQQSNQIFRPDGICVDQNKTLLIADCGNHRIVRWEWRTNKGTLVAGGNGQGSRMDQLNGPTDVTVDKHDQSIIIADRGNKRVIRLVAGSGTMNAQILIDNIECRGLAMDKEGFLYVSDREKYEVRQWKVGKGEGTIVAGGNGQGDRLNQLSVPTFLFVDDQQSIYVSDPENHRVMKWQKGAKEGTIVAGGNGQGNSLSQLYEPQGVIVNRWGQIYVADHGNSRVMCWREGEKEGEIVAGGNGYGEGSNQLSYPTGLSVDGEGNLYVADWWNHRIQKFDLILL